MTSYEVLFFDCDSTLTQVEGIDELGHRAGVGDRLAALTDRAMNGEIPLESVYGQRLELVRPSQQDIDWLGERYVEQLVPGTRELFDALRDLGKRVVIVSGGLHPAVAHLAHELGVEASEVHAVPLIFDDQGQYSGFVEAHPLARNGGKTVVCRNVLAGGTVRSAFVGDGKTDLEAGEVCDTVIGFGGVVARDAVRESADRFVEEANLTALAPHLFTADELAQVQRRLGR